MPRKTDGIVFELHPEGRSVARNLICEAKESISYF